MVQEDKLDKTIENVEKQSSYCDSCDFSNSYDVSDSYDVYVKAYDLIPNADKKSLSLLAGFEIEAVWHTAIEFHGEEFYFGNGIVKTPLNRSLGKFVEKEYLGCSKMKKEDFLILIKDLQSSEWSSIDYKLLEHNCNHFSNTLSKILVNKEIPYKYLKITEDAKANPLSKMFFRNMVDKQ